MALSAVLRSDRACEEPMVGMRAHLDSHSNKNNVYRAYGSQKRAGMEMVESEPPTFLTIRAEYECS